MRTLTPPAVLVVGGALIQNRPARTALLVAAIGELVVDKLPSTPSRTRPIGLAGRLVSGAGCGLFVEGPMGAAVATAASAAATFLTHDGRQAAIRAARLPDLPVALLEDVIAVSVASIGMKIVNGRPWPTRALD